MRHIRELEHTWRIRFRDRRRTPAEVGYSFDKASFSRRQILEERDRLRHRWKSGKWDPWSRQLPGQASEVTVPTLWEAIEAYCKHKRQLGRRHQQGGWNERTYANYKTNLLAFARFVGQHKQITRLSTDDLERWIFRQRLAKATQRMYRRQLQTFVRWLQKQYDVARDIELPPPFRTRRKLPSYLTEGELDAVCRAHEEICREKGKNKHAPKAGPTSGLARLWMNDAFKFAFYQGLRRGEVIALRVGAVDLERRRLRVGDDAFIPKGQDEHTITITPPARPILARYLDGRAPSERVFGYHSGGRLSACFKEALLRAFPEKGDVTFHSLRASCCVYWLEQGVALRDVKDLLRHQSITTTERYYLSVVIDGQTRRFEAAYRNEDDQQ